jgi:antitoxin ParD1/3/4
MPEIHLSEEHDAFLTGLVEAGFYRDVASAVAGGLRLLQQKDEQFFTLQKLIQEGLDDVEAGRVYRYGSAEEMLKDIKDMSPEKKTGTRY